MVDRVELTPQHATSWAAWVTDFDRTYSLFQQTLNRLRNVHAYVVQRHPELNNRYSTQYSSGMRLAAQLDTLKRQRDAVVQWLNSIGQAIRDAGAGTMEWLRTHFGLGSNVSHDLGAVVPLVYVAVGLTAAAGVLLLVARWITETEQLNIVIAEAQRLESQGVPPAEAARIARQYKDGGSPQLYNPTNNTVFGIPLMFVMVGAGALIILPMLFKRGD